MAETMPEEGRAGTASDEGSARIVFRKWDVDTDGTISQHSMQTALKDVVADASEEAMHALFQHIDADANGSIEYEEFLNWLFFSGVPQGCSCPDGHALRVYAPETDGWCCEECGDDLEVQQDALQCHECAGMCWCIKCAVQQSDVKVVEAFALAAVRATLAMHLQCAGEDVANEVVEPVEPEEPCCEAEDADACLPQASEPTEGLVTLNICGLAGSLCAVEADRQWTVLQLKSSIEAQTAIAEAAQSLVFAFMALQDRDVLGTLQIPDGADVFLMRRSDLQTQWLAKIRSADSKDSNMYGQAVLEFAPEEIRADRLIVLEAVSRCGLDFQYASSDLRADHEIAMAATITDPKSLRFAMPQLLEDREFAVEIVPKHREVLQFLSESLRADHEVVKVAVAADGLALQFATEHLWDNKDIVDLATAQGFTLQRARRFDRRGRMGLGFRFNDHKTLVLSAISREKEEVKYASAELLADKWFAMELLQQNPWHLQFLAKELTSDRDVITAALDCGFTLEDAPGKLRANPAIVHLAVQRRGLELMYSSQELRANRKIVLAALRNRGMALQYAAFQLRNERKVVAVAVKQDPTALKYAGAVLRNAL